MIVEKLCAQILKPAFIMGRVVSIASLFGIYLLSAVLLTGTPGVGLIASFIVIQTLLAGLIFTQAPSVILPWLQTRRINRPQIERLTLHLIYLLTGLVGVPTMMTFSSPQSHPTFNGREYTLDTLELGIVMR